MLIEKNVIAVLAVLHLFPNLFLTFNPFKMFEFQEMLRDVAIAKTDRILDIGCGNGIQTLLLGERCQKVTGIDVSDKAIRTADRISRPIKNRINSEFRCVRTEDGDFQKEQFDKIYSFSVIEHIPNYKEVLRECHRIVKLGGQLIFSTDSLATIKDQYLKKKHMQDHSVQRYFTKQEIKSTLEEAGFKRTKIYPIFTSNYAVTLFSQGIENGFQYGYLGSILQFLKLKKQEKLTTQNDNGIFLVIKAFK